MVSEIKSNTNDLLVVAGRLDNTARLEGTVDTAAWRKIMRDLADAALSNLIAIYKELDADVKHCKVAPVEVVVTSGQLTGPAEYLVNAETRERIRVNETACGDTDKECFEV